MSQPTPYTRALVYSEFLEDNPSLPPPAESLDADFDGIKTTLDETLENLELIQRDDGELANASVGRDQLKSDVVQGVNTPTGWVTGTDYGVRDSVVVGNSWYWCEIAHTADDAFADDLAAGRWELIFDFSTVATGPTGPAGPTGATGQVPAAFLTALTSTATGDGATVAFPVSFGASSYTTASFFVTVAGAVQEPTAAYTIAYVDPTTTFTFTSAPPTGARIVIRLMAGQILGYSPSVADAGKIIQVNATGDALTAIAGGGTGDVVGPASSTDHALALFNGATGKLLKNGPALGTDGHPLVSSGAGSAPAFEQLGSDGIINAAVTFAKIQNITADRLLGRSTAGDGVCEHIQVGTNLTLSAGVLSATGGAGGYSEVQDEGTPVTARSELNFTGAITATDNAGTAATDIALDADLEALAGVSATGMLARTGAGTAEARTLTAPAAGISVSNGNGVSGNPTLALANDLAAIEGLSTTGLVVRTGDGTATTRSVAASGAISVSNGDGVSGNPTVSVSAGGITSAMLRDSAAVSVIGRAANTTGVPADIAAGANDRLLARTSDSVAFQQLTVGMVPDATITLAKIANIATARLLGRTTASSGVIEELTAGTGLTVAAGALDLDNTAVTPAAYTNADITVDAQGRITAAANGSASGFNGGRYEIWIDAGHMIPRITTGCDPGHSETATNRVNTQSLDFSTSTQEFAQFKWRMPTSWNEGTVTFIPVWTAATGSGTVDWALQGVAFSNDDALEAAFGTEQVSSDTLIATGDVHAGPESSAITIAGTPAAGDLVVFQIKRNVSTDSHSADAKLLGLVLVITTNAGTDA